MSKFITNSANLLEKVPTTEIIDVAASLSKIVVSTASKVVPFLDSILAVIGEVEHMHEQVSNLFSLILYYSLCRITVLL